MIRKKIVLFLITICLIISCIPLTYKDSVNLKISKNNLDGIIILIVSVRQGLDIHHYQGRYTIYAKSVIPFKKGKLIFTDYSTKHLKFIIGFFGPSEAIDYDFLVLGHGMKPLNAKYYTSEAHYIYNKKVIPTHNVATKPYKNSDEWISSLEDIYCEFILKKCSKYVISFFKGAMRERNGKSINNYEENDFSDKDYKLLRSFLCSELDSLERKHPKYFDRTRKFKTYLKCSK